MITHRVLGVALFDQIENSRTEQMKTTDLGGGSGDGGGVCVFWVGGWGG